MAGAIGGLILAPMLAAPPEARGLPFVPSMALGAMILAPTIAACLACAAPLSAVSFTRVSGVCAAACCGGASAVCPWHWSIAAPWLCLCLTGHTANIGCTLGATHASPVVPQATSSRAAGPGMAAGFCWNAGNCCCILAVTDPRVGLAVAMPIMQV